ATFFGFNCVTSFIGVCHFILECVGGAITSGISIFLKVLFLSKLLSVFVHKRMRVLGKSRILKVKKKNIGNKRLCDEIDKLIFDIERLIEIGSIKNELDYESTLVADRKLKLLGK